MTNMTMRMFVSGVESLATDTLGTKNLRYVQLNACSAMPLNQKKQKLRSCTIPCLEMACNPSWKGTGFGIRMHV